MITQSQPEILIATNAWEFSEKLRIGFNYYRRYAINAGALLLGDIFGLTIAFELAAIIRWSIFGEAMSHSWNVWLCAFWVIGAIPYKLVPAWGMSPVESLRRQVSLVIGVFLVTAAALFLSKAGIENSRLTFTIALMLAVPLVPFSRMLMKRQLIRQGLWGIPVAIYGGGEAGCNVIKRLNQEAGQGYCPVCVFDDNPALMNRTIEGVPVRGRTNEIAKNVNVAIVAITRIDGEQLSEMIAGSLSSYFRIIIIPNLIHTPWLWATSKDLSGIPSLEMKNNLLDPSKRAIKRAAELSLTLSALPLWLPLYLLISQLIKLEDGADPVFKQKRIGEGGETFETWKFRTMVPNAEKVLYEALDKAPELKNEWEQNCKLRNDPRITKVGKILRKTSLDEIPQLVNVLRGEMSLVGPRPLPSYHYDQLPKDVQRLRERVKPGMTGLWQVSGRSDVGNDGMIRFDPYYVRNWSLWLDIVIMVRTVDVVARGSGAH